MKVLDVGPLHDGLRRNITMLHRLDTEIQMIEQSIKKLVALEDSLKGEGGNAIRSFYEECHLPFLQFFSTFQSRFVSVLERMDAALESLEPDLSGFIRESYLEGEIEQGLTHIAQITESLTDEANGIMDQVADIIGLPHLDDCDVHEGVQRAKVKRNNTVTDLHEFDATQTAALSPIETDLATMESWLANIESLFTDGTTAIDFQVTHWTSLSAENTLTTDLAHRTAEMPGISNTTDNELESFFKQIGSNAIITKDAKLIAFFKEREKNRISGSPHNNLINPETGEYLMWNQGAARVSKDYGPRHLSLLDKAGLGVANFIFLDDWKTLGDSKASIGSRGFAAFSLSPQGKIIKTSVKFVNNSIVGKVVKPKKVPSKSTDNVEISGVNQKTNIDGFDAKTATNKQKGNYGEIRSSHDLMNNQSLKDAGYDLKPVGRVAPTSINDKIVHGIDGLYENMNPNSTIKYVIDEAKFGSSQLTKKAIDGPQMSDGWLTGGESGKSRILKAVNENLILTTKITTALEKGQVERVLSRIDQNGNIKTFKLDANGKVIGDWP